MGRYPYGEPLVMVAIQAYAPLEGKPVYWTGIGWDAQGTKAALYADRDIAWKLSLNLTLPDGAPEAVLSHRNLI
jgi:hypothetical protein